jgi:hypothetical protein
MMAALSMTVQAADETLTLACQGTATDITQPVDGKPEPTSMGIIINFAARTVVGLDFPLKITSSDEAMVFFGGSNDTERTFPEDFRQHRPRDRRHEGRFNQDGQEHVHLVRRGLRPEMQASATDVLRGHYGSVREGMAAAKQGPRR